MRDEIVALLRAPGECKRIGKATLAAVAEHFVDQFLTNLEKRARHHPLGFVVISEPIDESLVLRYHLWPTDWAVPPGQENGQTHDHCFELTSLIVGGSLRQQTYRPVLDEDGGYEVVSVDYTSGRSELHRTGTKARLEPETDKVFDGGTVYRLVPGVVHYIETVRRPAATLVLAISSPGAAAPQVYIPVGRDMPGEFARDLLNSSELSSVRAAVASLC